MLPPLPTAPDHVEPAAFACVHTSGGGVSKVVAGGLLQIVGGDGLVALFFAVFGTERVSRRAGR